MTESKYTPPEAIEDQRKLDPRNKLSLSELHNLMNRIADDDSSAKEEIVNQYEWLIESYITRYFEEYDDSYHEDLLQEGRLAILKSVAIFNKEKKYNINSFFRI